MFPVACSRKNSDTDDLTDKTSKIPFNSKVLSLFICLLIEDYSELKAK